jgi:excisionase family DNA binding protein
MEITQLTQLLTVKQVAKRLQVSQVWVYSLVRQGKIPFLHIEKALRFDPEALQAWLEAKRNIQWHRGKLVKNRSN